MKLISLALENFRQHRQYQVQFVDGITGVVGRNGSGKTTILEAISFALYGSKALRGKVEDVKTKTAEKIGKCSVTVVFQHDEKIFRIIRTLTDAQIFQGGEESPFITGTREVSAAVSSRLEMDYEEFNATYLTEQKSLEFLGNKKGAAERERFILKMLGYNRIERVQELLRLERNSVKGELIGLEAGIGTRSDLEDRLESEKKNQNVLQEKYQESFTAHQNLEKELVDLKIRFERQDKLRKEYEFVSNQIKDAEIRKDSILKRLIFVQTKTEGFSEDVYKTNSLNFTKINSLKIQAEKKLDLLIDKWKEERLILGSKINSLENELKKVNATLANLADYAGEECPTCGQVVNLDEQGHKNHFEDKKLSLENEILILKKQYLPFLDKPCEIIGVEDEISTFNMQLQELGQKGQHLELQKKLLEESQGLVRESSDVNELITGYQKNLSGVNFSENQYLKEKAAYEATNRLHEVARLQKVKTEGELNTCKALVARTKSDIESFNDKLSMLSQKKKRYGLLEEGDRVLNDFKKHLNAGLRPLIADRASEYLADLTDGKYTTIDLGIDFVPTVIDDGAPKPVISGGEEDIVNLCMRLALSSILADRAGHTFSLLILDEVFGALDEQRRGNVLFLLDKLRGRFEQIIIVTHLEDIREGVESLVEL